MFAYKTNSPDYLDYVASTLTREQIKADPDLCLLLENEYIKDNMELAIRWNAAKTGDYQDKYNFVEYLMCNGPEVDADTILHYRNKIQSDDVCMEIAYSYLSDVNTLIKIRKDIYKKDSDECFQNPCFYLGKFSTMMGSCGDVKNTYSPFNTIANWINGSVSHEVEARAKAEEMFKKGMITASERDQKIEDAKRLDEEEQRRDDGVSGVTGSRTIVKPTVNNLPKSGDLPPPPPPGGMRNCFKVGIIPALEKGWNMMCAQIFEGDMEFTNELINNTKCVTNAKRVGDWMATPVAEMIDLVSKANVRRQMGDCARLWSHVRRLRLFGSENSYGPIRSDQLVGNTYPDGTPRQPVANPQPTAADASATVDAMRVIKVEDYKK